MGTHLSFLNCLSRKGINVSRREVSWNRYTSSTTATLSDKQQGIIYMHFPTDRIAQTMAFIKQVINPIVGVSDAHLLIESLWVGAHIDIKNSMPRLIFDLSTYQPQVR